jgi:hypothetical protein
VVATHKCRICEHPERALVDRVLRVGQSPRSVARRYSDTSRKALTRHRDVCLKDVVVEGDDAA